MPSQNYLSKPHETPVTVAISNCNCNAVNAANAASCCLLKCAAWMYTKIKCGPWCTNQPLGSVKDRLMAMPCLLHNGPLRPGTISIHHFLCSKNGLIGHTIGKLTNKTFHGRAVFVDTKSREVSSIQSCQKLLAG